MAMLLRSLLPRVGILSPPEGCPRLIRCLSSAAVCPPARAAVYHQHGAPDHVLQLVEVEGRELLEGEVCVKMLAAPINPSDINRIEGVYPMRPPLPAVGGTEGVGVVVSVAPGVSKLKVNDWVIPSHPHIGISLYNLQAKVSLACFSQFFVGSTRVYYDIHMSKENLHTAAESTGTWRTYIAKEESAWCLVAKDVPEKYAATVSVNPCTALRMLQDIVDLKPGASVVQNGATSMVGQCVIQLARLNDLHTINLIRDRPDLDSVKERLKALGADYVLTEEELGSLDKKTLAGRAQAKLGLNCVGGSAATAVMKLLGEGGVMVTYGGMAKKPITVSTGPLIFKDLRLQGFWLGKWKSNHSDEEFSTMVNYLLRLVCDGKLQYAMDEVQFSDFDTALRKALGQQGSALKQVLIFN